jgi:hypothetical protein
MVLSIVVPELNFKPNTTKDAVISILTIEWPLSLRTIFNRIKKQYGYSSTYQAVFKAVKELCEMAVLRENDKKYEINISWIKKVQSFTDIVETNYYAKERMQSISGVKDSKQKGDIMVLNFESIFDAEKYLYYFMKSVLFKKRNDTVCYHTNNEWRPIFYLRSEYNYYRRLAERGHEFYFLCSGNSQMEKLCGQFYKSIGVNFKTTKQRFANDLLVFDEYFIHIFIPEDFKNKMKQMLDRKDIMHLLHDVLDTKTSVRVVITKDKDLAAEIKKQTISNFSACKH